MYLGGVAAPSVNWRTLTTVAAVLVISVACTPQRPEHDLTVTNGWVMDLAIQVSVDPLAPQDQRSTLGIVRIGETRTFAHALQQQDRYAIHARYDANRLEFDTVCLSRPALEQLGWSIIIPGTPSACPY